MSRPPMTDDDLRHLWKVASVGLAGMQDPDFMRWLAWEADEKDRADYQNAIGIIGDAFTELAQRQGMLPTFRVPAGRHSETTT